MTLGDLDRIARLEGENSQLRQLVDAERRHLAALRETVRRLHEELDQVRRRGDALTDENTRLRAGRSRDYTWPMIGVVGVALAGARLLTSRRTPTARL